MDVTAIEGIAYPRKLKDVLKDKPLATAFLKYVQRTKGLHDAYRFAKSTNSAKVLFESYLHDRAPYKVNIKADVQKKLMGFAHLVELEMHSWDEPAIKKIIAAVQAQTRKVIEDEHLGVGLKFYESKEFRTVHDPRVKATVDHHMAAVVEKKDINAKSLKLLGFKKLKDSKIHKAVHKMAEGFLSGDRGMSQNGYGDARDLDPAFSTPYGEMKKLMVKAKIIPA